LQTNALLVIPQVTSGLGAGFFMGQRVNLAAHLSQRGGAEAAHFMSKKPCCMSEKLTQVARKTARILKVI
jgi:hypothetical protein